MSGASGNIAVEHIEQIGDYKNDPSQKELTVTKQYRRADV
jgi:hypothetical protein